MDFKLEQNISVLKKHGTLFESCLMVNLMLDHPKLLVHGVSTKLQIVKLCSFEEQVVLH